MSQEQRERKVTVDEVPSGIYLYPEEDPGADNIFSGSSCRCSSALFEEAKKELLKLMNIQVCVHSVVLFRLPKAFQTLQNSEIH